MHQTRAEPLAVLTEAHTKLKTGGEKLISQHHSSCTGSDWQREQRELIYASTTADALGFYAHRAST